MQQLFWNKVYILHVKIIMKQISYIFIYFIYFGENFRTLNVVHLSEIIHIINVKTIVGQIFYTNYIVGEAIIKHILFNIGY